MSDTPDTGVANVGNAPYFGGVSRKESAATLLRRLREEQGRSLRSVADEVGIAASQLSRIERGERGCNTTVGQRLAYYYGLPPELLELMEGTVPPDIVAILQAHPEELDRLRRLYGGGAEAHHDQRSARGLEEISRG
ncbi:helix-turn-helix domain-containing protein [Micromonospora chersina]|uniref:helix-turn-helix domain-containing protein n=1 Tax=Micromonospora chersina TaxID=47854 RepID=UPI0033E2E74A